MQPVVSQKSLSLLSFKLLTQLEKIKCKRFEWIKDAREGILKSWGESRVEYRDWLQQVTHEIQQLNDMGDGASAEWLAHTLLREPSILESPHLELTIPTGQGMEVIIFKGFAEGAYTVTPAGHHPSQVEAAPSRATEDPIVPEPPRTPAVTMRSEPVAPDTSAAELTEGPTIAARNQVPRARETVSHPQRPTGETSGENNSSIGDAAPVKGKTAPATAKFRHLAAKPPAVERTEAPKTTADGHLTGVHEIVARLDEVGEGSGEHNSSTGDGAVVEEDAYANDITFIKECPDKRRPASKKKRKRRAASAPANNEDNETIGRKRTRPQSVGPQRDQKDGSAPQGIWANTWKPPKSTYDGLTSDELRSELRERGIPASHCTIRKWLLAKLLQDDKVHGCLPESLLEEDTSNSQPGGPAADE